MVNTKIISNFVDPKRSFDEVSLARCCVMATESLGPDEFDAWVIVYNFLIDRRRLQNEKITFDD